VETPSCLRINASVDLLIGVVTRSPMGALSSGVRAAGIVAVGCGVSLQELVVGDADGLESLNQ
jgi:hypothetical protein